MPMCFKFGIAEEAIKSKGQNQQGTVSTEECVPPHYVFSSEEILPLLEPLFPPDTETKVSHWGSAFSFSVSDPHVHTVLI